MASLKDPKYLPEVYHGESQSASDSTPEKISEIDSNPRQDSRTPVADGSHSAPLASAYTTQSSHRVASPTIFGRIWTWFSKLDRKNPWRNLWFYLMLLACIAAVIAPLSVRLVHKKDPLQPLTITNATFPERPPVANSNVAAAVSWFSVSFSERIFGAPGIKLAYNTEGSDGWQICILTKKANSTSWDTLVECIGGLNIKPNSPLAMLDWVGGASIFFITKENHISGIDSVCHPQTTNCDVLTWKRSPLESHSIPVHPESHLSSLTWEFGASAWTYYQAPNNNTMQEYGCDDFRDRVYRGGSTDPILKCQAGTAIASSRWVNGSDELCEVFGQVENNSIRGRLFVNGEYLDEYTAVGPIDFVARGSPITATTVNDGNRTITLLAYITPNGYLKAQTRSDANLTLSMPNFSSPVQIVGNAEPKSGLTSASWPGNVNIFFVVGTKIMEASSDNSTAILGQKWTISDVGSG